MQDAWRTYLELAMGLTEASRKRAPKASGGWSDGRRDGRAAAGAGRGPVAAGAANREALTKLVRFEVDRALGVVGLATADEVAS